MRPLCLAGAEWLVGPAGQAALAQVAELDPSAGDLARLSALRAAGHDADHAGWALDQARLRTKAAGKFGPLAARLLFTQEALEQASSLEIATWRAERLAAALAPGARVLEVGAAVGGDTLALARAGLAVVAAELDPVRACLLRWNLAQAGLEAEVLAEDATSRAWSGLAAVYADPARRKEGRRLLGLEQGSPPLSLLRGLGCPELLVKGAPGLPLHEVPASLGLGFVAAGGELKEALLAGGALREVFGAAPGEGRAIRLPGPLELRGPSELPARVAEPGPFLYEPHPAAIRAGLVRHLGTILEAWQLDAQIVYLSGAEERSSPFATAYRVLDHGPYRRKQVVRWVRTRGAGQVEVKQRGLRGDPGELAKRLPRAKGGPTLTLCLLQRDAGPWALLCERITPR